ncbi:MAG: hypothetical protein HYY24_18020 [Verrucomicrobia bacterium]|nr:hypothetical protein [Verrucomicrobiota bacterium]
MNERCQRSWRMSCLGLCLVAVSALRAAAVPVAPEERAEADRGSRADPREKGVLVVAGTQPSAVVAVYEKRGEKP